MAKNTGALGSRPKNDFQKKLVGIVSVVTGKQYAKFTLEDEGKTFKTGETYLKVKFEDLPKYPKLAPDEKGRQFRIRMNQDGTEVEALTPVVGHFRAKMVDIGPHPEGKDSDPMPFEKTFERGDVTNSHLEFFGVYKIISGNFKNVEMPGYYLHYKFEEDDARPGYARFAGNFENKKATRLFQLRDWGNIHQLWSDPIEWDNDTILPELLERALDSDVEVDLIVKDGYIREILPVEGEDPDFMRDSKGEEDAVDEEFPKKSTKTSPAKKSVKKVKKSKVEEEDEEL